MYFYNTEKTKYSAMMLAIGLNQRKLFFMQIFEVIIDGIFAMLIGGILSAVLVALLIYTFECLGKGESLYAHAASAHYRIQDEK